ncbi:MAG: MATE family efflux transporter [Lachnospiraceae bacterium]|nr:MATE family efflux transporter [Lachnospiraceae bacterium]
MKERFDNGKFLKALLMIAVPVAFQNLLTTTGSMVDTIMLGKLGENTVGAVGLCAQFSSLMLSCYWGFLGGGMMFISQYWGEGNKDGIRHSYGILFMFMMSVAFIFAGLGILAPEKVMDLYTNNAVIKEIAVPYLRLAGFAYPIQVLCMCMGVLMRCTEHVTIPLIGGIASVITNCVVNYILIFGHFGFPVMGVRGAAAGTIVAAVVNLIIIVICAKVSHIPFLFDISEHFKWSAALLKEFLKRSFPILCNEIAIGVGNMLINVVLGRQTSQIIAAVAVFRVIEGMVIAFFSGFSSAASVLVGKEAGAGNHEDAYRRAIRIVYLTSFMVFVLFMILIGVHGPMFRAMSLDGASFGYATEMLIIFSVLGTVRMGNWCHNDTFRSAGDSAYGSILEITFMFCMVIPAVYIANFALKLEFRWVFALCYCDEVIRYVMMQVHLYGGKWIRPVSESGLKTIGEFRKRHGIKEKA